MNRQILILLGIILILSSVFVFTGSADDEKITVIWKDVDGDDEKKFKKFFKGGDELPWIAYTSTNITVHENSIAVQGNDHNLTLTYTENNEKVTLKLDGKKYNIFDANMKSGSLTLVKNPFFVVHFLEIIIATIIVFFGIGAVILKVIPTSNANRGSKHTSGSSYGKNIMVQVIDDAGNSMRGVDISNPARNGPGKLSKTDSFGKSNLFSVIDTKNISVCASGYTEKERKLSGNILTVVLLKPQTLQLKLVDEVTNQPISHVRVKATKDDGFDLSSSPGFMPSSDEMGIVTIKNIAGNVNEGTISINDCGYEFTKTFNLTDNQYKNPEVIYLSKLTGMLIAKLDCNLSGLSIVAKNIENKSVYTKETDGDVADFRRIPVGSYQLYVEPNPLFESETKLINIDTDREIEETLSIKTTYALGVDKKRKINQIKDLILGSYDEVSSYDTCIPQYLMRIAEAPLDFIENIDDKLVHFIGCAISPQEFTQYMLDTSEILGSEISTTIRSKNNIDLYAEASGLPAVTSIGISPYSGSELKDMLQDITNYYENNYRAVGNKLYKDLDNEITQKSDELTIYPIAETWDVAKKLMELSNSELQNKAKQAVMLYIVNHLLINIEEMFHNEDVLKRLRLSTF